MAITKNPGPLLSTAQLGERTQIPSEFIAAMNLVEEVIAVPLGTPPDDLSDTVIFSKCEMVRTNERVKHTFRKRPGPIVLRDVRTNQDGQPVQTTRTLYLTSSQPPTPPSATTKVAIQDLGNLWSIQEVSVDGIYDDQGNFVPSIFGGPRYEKSIPDTVPDRFKVAVPTTRTDLTVAGVATVPNLGTGDLDKSEEQIDSFKKRTSTTTRSGIALPVVLIGKSTSQEKQVVTITDTYKLAGSDAVPTALKDVDVQNMGDGRVVQMERTIPYVFPSTEYMAEVPDTIPAEFQNLVPKRTTIVTEEGQGTPPNLGALDLLRRVSQLDAFRLRSEVVTRDSSLFPQTLQDAFFGGPSDGSGSRFTGIVQSPRTISSIIQTPDNDFQHFESKVTNIGAGGLSIKESSFLSSYPTLTENEFDPQTRTTLQRQKSLVAANTALPASSGLVFYRQKALDSQRTEQIKETITDVSLTTANVYKKFRGYIDVSLPVQLLSITGIANPLGAGSSYTNNQPIYNIAGNGSATLSLRGSAGATAGVTTDVTYDYKQPWGRDVICWHWLFPVLRTNANLRNGSTVALWNNLFGPSGTVEQNATLNLWPKFAPRPVLITCKGMKVDAEVEGEFHAADTTRLDYLGTVKSTGQYRNYGAGGRVSSELVTKIVRIPDTIHPSLTITQPSSSDLNPTAYGTGAMIGPGFLNTFSADLKNSPNNIVKGSITPTSVPATPGINTIPTSGLYMYKFFMESYNYDFVLLHYINVDFADIL